MAEAEEEEDDFQALVDFVAAHRPVRAGLAVWFNFVCKLYFLKFLYYPLTFCPLF